MSQLWNAATSVAGIPKMSGVGGGLTTNLTGGSFYEPGMFTPGATDGALSGITGNNVASSQDFLNPMQTMENASPATNPLGFGEASVGGTSAGGGAIDPLTGFPMQKGSASSNILNGTGSPAGTPQAGGEGGGFWDNGVMDFLGDENLNNLINSGSQLWGMSEKSKLNDVLKKSYTDAGNRAETAFGWQEEDRNKNQNLKF